MSDAELRHLARTWRAERTIDSAAAYVAARLRRGRVADDERAAWREAAARGDPDAAEELFVDALLGDDPADLRRALSTLDGTPGVDRHGSAPDSDGVLRAPITLRWPRPTDDGTPGERFVAGWLANLTHAERVLAWSRALLSEPAVGDDERRAVLSGALAEERVDVDALDRRHLALVRIVTLPVIYTTGSYMEGGPPTIECTFPMLVHELLRRALLLSARSDAGRASAEAIVRTVLERPQTLQPTRCEIRLSPVQRIPLWRGVLREVDDDDDGRSREHAVAEAARQQIDSLPLRAVLSVIAARQHLLLDERIRAAVDWLVTEGAERSLVRRALALHLVPALPHLPPPLARALIERAATWADGPSSFAETLLRRAEGFPEALRETARRALLQLASRGGYVVDAFEDVVVAALTPGGRWPYGLVQGGAPGDGPGPWLRALAPELLRALATSSDSSARALAAAMWRGGPPDRYPGLTDLWQRLENDENEWVRAALREGHAID